MLPPDNDDYYGDRENGEYPFSPDNFPDIYENYYQAQEAFDAISGYFKDIGFSNEEWFARITGIDNIWYDEEGGMHFDFIWDYDGITYGGSIK